MIRICLLWALPVVGLAHPALETRINDLTQAITQVPDSAELYLRRGHLYAQHGDADLARKDYEAARLISESAQVLAALGDLHYAAGEHARAHTLFAAALDKSEDHTAAWLGQARASVALGDYELATISYRTYFERADHPQPGYMAAAVRAIAPHDRDAAIDLLSAALERLGPVPTLLKLEEQLNTPQ